MLNKKYRRSLYYHHFTQHLIRKIRENTTNEETGEYDRYDDVEVNGSWSYAFLTETYLKGIPLDDLIPKETSEQDEEGNPN